MMRDLLADRDHRRRIEIYGQRQIFDTVIRHHLLGLASPRPIGRLAITVISSALLTGFVQPSSLALRGRAPGFATRR
jgi:hypothetical protein